MITAVKRASFLVVASLYVAMIASACTGNGAPRATATTAPPTHTASAPDPATGTAAVTPTGTTATREQLPPGVDLVIQRVLRGDIAGVQALVRLTTVACGPQQGFGSPPPCPPGQPTGSPVEVFPVGTCEAELRPPSAVRRTLQSVVSADPRLYGVFRAPEGYLPYVDGDYIAVFSRRPPMPEMRLLGAGLVIERDRIVGIWFGCQSDPTAIVPPDTPALLLPGG